jgi:hypothetical protein
MPPSPRLLKTTIRPDKKPWRKAVSQLLQKPWHARQGFLYGYGVTVGCPSRPRPSAKPPQESWVEKVPQPSSSSLSSTGDEIVTTGLRVQQLPNSHRKLQSSASHTFPQQRQTTSSQKENEEFGNGGDQVIAISNDHAISTTLPNHQLIVQPSPGPDFKSTLEHHYFVVFRESAAAQLSGYYDSSLWDRVILQACHQERWAVNLVVAIGALYQSLNTSPTHSHLPRGMAERERKSHYIFALQQYGAALEQLQTVSEQEHRSESSIRLALISSLLTTCCETYIGDRDKAITQSEAGIDLLLNWMKQEEPTGDLVDDWSHVWRIASRFPNLEDEILSAFQRLDYQILLYRGFQPNRHAPQAFPTATYPFTSINEACNFWDQVMRRVLYFHGINNITEQHSAFGYEDDDSRASGKEYPMHTLVESHNFKTTTEKFLRYFNPIFQSSRQWPETKDYLLANLVMIRVLSCRAALSQRPSASELYGNDFLRDYIKVIELARELIDNSKITLRNAIFSFDITLGVSIFSLSRLCREPAVRRQAIELLHQCPQREGWFDAMVFAKISTWLMNKEEEGKVRGHIPDIGRLRLIKHELGPYNRTAKLYYSRFIWKDGNAARELLPPFTIIF